MLNAKPLQNHLWPLSGLLSAIAYWPLWQNGATAPRWGILAFVCVLGARHWLGWGAAITITLLALLVDWNNYDSIQAFCLYTILLLAFHCRVGDKFWYWLAFGVALSAWPVLWQLGGEWPFEQAASPGGLFNNKNLLGEAAALALAIAFWQRRWAMALVLAFCLFASGSRGALLALVGMFCVFMWARSPKLVFGLALLAVAGLLWAVWLTSETTISPRLAALLDILPQLGLLPHGIGTYYQLAPTFAEHSDVYVNRNTHLHNDWIELAFEIGLLGFAVVLAAYGFALRYANPLGKALLVGIGLLALVAFPWHNPLPAAVGALCLGDAFRRRRDVDRLLVDSGAVVCASPGERRAADGKGASGGEALPVGHDSAALAQRPVSNGLLSARNGATGD